MKNIGGYIAIGMRQLLHEYLDDNGVDANALIGKVPTVPPREVGRYPLASFVADLDKASEALG